MIEWPKVNELQDKKLNLQLELSNLLDDKEVSIEKINELRSEIKHLDNELERILGSNVIENQKKINKKKSGIDERNLNSFYALKEKYKKINSMDHSINNLIKVLTSIISTKDVVKVKK
ncbi:MAG: hypothetical protein Q4E75_03415 [bacterium]|nr:hypothetical protein [bacterium]